MVTTIEGTNKNTTSEIATGVDASADIDSLLANVADLITRTKGLNDIHDDVGTVDTVVDAIKTIIDNLPDSGALNDLALILSEVAGLNGDAMRGTNNVPTNPMLDSENGASFSAIPDMALDSTVAKDATVSKSAGAKGTDATFDEVAGLNGEAMRGTDGVPTNPMLDIEDGLSFTAIPDMALATELAKRKECICVIKTVTFDGGAGSGAVGVVDLFTVTGGVDISIEVFCTTSLEEAGATATIEIGISGETDYIIPTTDAVDIDITNIWHDATPASAIELTSDANKEITINDSDIIATIAVQNVTVGVIEFSIIYTPRTSGAAVTAA